MLKSVTLAVNDLSNDPHPSGTELIKPYTNVYGLRQGYIRIIYEIHEEEVIIMVLEIGKRGQIYNDW